MVENYLLSRGTQQKTTTEADGLKKRRDV